MQRILFYRNYQQYTGGHQKVRDYIAHFVEHADYEVSLFLEPQSSSIRSAVEPALFENIQNVLYPKQYRPSDYDLVFLAGMDWQAYLSAPQKAEPHAHIINLIQHVRHADAQHPLFAFLQEPALRLCVSETVKEAIAPFANGPCEHVPMGHNISDGESAKNIDIYILAKKRPAWGQAIADWATEQGFGVLLHKTNTPKQQVHQAMASAKISVCLPHPTEGFYLPSIEAMALSDCAVVPDCIVNREYKTEGDNLLICGQNMMSVKNAIIKAVNLCKEANHAQRKSLGIRTAKSYTLAREKAVLFDILQSLKLSN